MRRIAAFGFWAVTSSAGFAGNPVSVHPPGMSGSSLNQSLPAAIQSAMPAGTPAPMMSSTPSWGVGSLMPTPAATIPTVGPNYLMTAPAPVTAPVMSECATGSCAPVRQHFNMLSPLRGCRTATCDGTSTLTFLERIRAWLGFQRTPSGVPTCVPYPYHAPLRTYFPPRPSDCGVGDGGCAAGAAGPVRERGLFRPTCDVTIPTTALPASNDCAPACRPRVVYTPLSPRDEGATCGEAAGCRPTPVRRMLTFIAPGGGRFGADGCTTAGGTGCASGDCPPAPPVMVRYANPAAPISATVRYAQPCTSPQAPTPAANTPQQGVPAKGPAPITTVPVTQPFTNP